MAVLITLAAVSQLLQQLPSIARTILITALILYFLYPHLQKIKRETHQHKVSEG